MEIIHSLFYCFGRLTNKGCLVILICALLLLGGYMENKEDVLIKKDELGIIPLNAKELLAEDLKVILAKLEERFDLENDKTKESFSWEVKFR